MPLFVVAGISVANGKAKPKDADDNIIFRERVAGTGMQGRYSTPTGAAGVRAKRGKGHIKSHPARIFMSRVA